LYWPALVIQKRLQAALDKYPRAQTLCYGFFAAQPEFQNDGDAPSAYPYCAADPAFSADRKDWKHFDTMSVTFPAGTVHGSDVVIWQYAENDPTKKPPAGCSSNAAKLWLQNNGEGDFAGGLNLDMCAINDDAKLTQKATDFMMRTS
jgi:hypothetical protein